MWLLGELVKFMNVFKTEHSCKSNWDEHMQSPSKVPKLQSDNAAYIYDKERLSHINSEGTTRKRQTKTPQHVQNAPLLHSSPYNVTF